jgi:excinuclease ABC subunit A
VTIAGKSSPLGPAARELSVAEVLDLTVNQALSFFAADYDIRTKLQPLSDVGLDYLKLGQPVPTLSGGESQRLKLAGFLAQAASQGLTQDAHPGQAFNRAGRKGTLFLFDEPTTGLHFDDVARLLRALRKLMTAGHSLLIVEHNLDVIRAADWVIDLGPEGGERGGMLVAAGTPEDLIARRPRTPGGRWRSTGSSWPRAPRRWIRWPRSVAKYNVNDDAGVPLASALRQRGRKNIFVHNAREHNLKNIDVEIPREKFTVITGVSGSGKSTLAFDVVFGEGQRRYLESLNAYARQFVQPATRPDVDGIFGIPPTVAIEQRTSRGGRKSTVATTDRDLSLPAPALCEAGHAVLPHDGAADASRRASSASPRS